jgi:hypothetical protein
MGSRPEGLPNREVSLNRDTNYHCRNPPTKDNLHVIESEFLITWQVPNRALGIERMRCKLALVAKDIIVSHDTNVPSAINILEGIQAGGFPIFLQEIAFLTVWAKDPGDPEDHVGYLVVRLDNNELIRQQISFSFQRRPTIRNISKFQGLVIPQPGDLEFRAEFGALVASYHITVSLQRQVEPVQPNQPELPVGNVAPAPAGP